VYKCLCVVCVCIYVFVCGVCVCIYVCVCAIEKGPRAVDKALPFRPFDTLSLSLPLIHSLTYSPVSLCVCVCVCVFVCCVCVCVHMCARYRKRKALPFRPLSLTHLTLTYLTHSPLSVSRNTGTSSGMTPRTRPAGGPRAQTTSRRCAPSPASIVHGSELASHRQMHLFLPKHVQRHAHTHTYTLSTH